MSSLLVAAAIAAVSPTTADMAVQSSYIPRNFERQLEVGYQTGRMTRSEIATLREVADKLVEREAVYAVDGIDAREERDLERRGELLQIFIGNLGRERWIRFRR